MRALPERLAGALHTLLALAAVWLLASSPWLHMYSRLPRALGLINGAHLVLGVLVAVWVTVFLWHTLTGSRWRLYLPWLGGGMGAVWADLAGLARGRLPMVEGGGLLAMIEGLLLLALLATGLSGLVWLALQGTPAATDWADVHAGCARAFAGLLLLHVAAVALHWLELIRN